MHGLITISKFRVNDNDNNAFNYNTIHSYNKNIDNKEYDDNTIHNKDNDDHTYFVNICY